MILPILTHQYEAIITVNISNILEWMKTFLLLDSKSVTHIKI